jgi:acid phosphatase (class A)
MRPHHALRTFALALALGSLLAWPGLRAAGAATLGAPAQEAVKAPPYADLIGDFPRPGSDAASADRAILLWMQATRTPEEVARAQSEARPHLGLLSAAAGADLESPAFVRTRALCEELAAALRTASGALKDHFARPRPYLTLPEVQPAVTRPFGPSYPSEHASWGVSQAMLLAELQPGRRRQLLERGRQSGYDRVLGGVHYPSDVQAGQKLGAFLAEAWLADPAHRLRVDQARPEWQR